MDANTVRGLINQILIDIDGLQDIHAAWAVTRCADAMFEGVLFGQSPSEYRDAIDAVLAAGQLPTPAERLSRRHSSADLLGFLRALGAELTTRLSTPQQPAAPA